VSTIPDGFMCALNLYSTQLPIVNPGLKMVICTASYDYSRGIQDSWLACPSLQLLAKSTNKSLGLGHPILSTLFSIVTPEDYFTAHNSSYSQGIQDGWLACPSLQLLAKSTNNLGHPILSLLTPAIVKVFRMVGWSVLPSNCLLKVRTI
jgi:hypothetical protein